MDICQESDPKSQDEIPVVGRWGYWDTSSHHRGGGLICIFFSIPTLINFYTNHPHPLKNEEVKVQNRKNSHQREPSSYEVVNERSHDRSHWTILNLMGLLFLV